MQGIQLTKSGIRLLAILLVLICLPLLLFFLNTGNDSIMQDTQTVDTNQDSISVCGVGKDTWRSIVHQNPLVDLFVHDTDFSQNMRRLLSWENKRRMMTFCGLSYSLFLRTTPSYVSLSRYSKIPVCKIKYFLIAPYSPNAPPFILA